MIVKRATIVLVLLPLLFISCIKGDKGQIGPIGPQGEIGPTNPDNLIVLILKQSNSYLGVSDTSLESDYPNSTNGTYDKIEITEDPLAICNTRPLIKFDLSTIFPSNIIVEKAYLSLFVFHTVNQLTIVPRAVLSPWDENNATWYENGFGDSWSGGILSPNPYGDPVTITGSNVYITLEIDSSLINQWLSLPQTNNGIALTAQSASTLGTVLFASSESYEYMQPKLTLYYRLPI